MADTDEFERLKTAVFNTYTEYINKVLTTSLEDLKDVDKRIELIGIYKKVFDSNTAYRDFVSGYRERSGEM